MVVPDVPVDEWQPRAGPIAAPRVRVVAALVDLVVATGCFALATTTPLWFGVPILLLVLGANEIVGIALWGQSIGKAVVGIRVLKVADARVPRFGTALLRALIENISFGVSFHPFANSAWSIIVGPWPLICYWPILRDPVLRQGLHDRIAGTVVVVATPTDRG